MWGTQLSKSIPQYGLHELFHHGRCGEWPSEHLWNCWLQPEIRWDNSHLGCKRPLVNTGDKLPTSGWFSGWVSEPSTAVWPIFWIPSCGVFHPFTWNPVISREKVIASTKQKLVFFSQMTRNHHQTLKRYLKWRYKKPHQLYGYGWCKGKPTSKLAKVLSYLKKKTEIGENHLLKWIEERYRTQQWLGQHSNLWQRIGSACCCATGWGGGQWPTRGCRGGTVAYPEAMQGGNFDRIGTVFFFSGQETTSTYNSTVVFCFEGWFKHTCGQVLKQTFW